MVWPNSCDDEQGLAKYLGRLRVTSRSILLSYCQIFGTSTGVCKLSSILGHKLLVSLNIETREPYLLENGAFRGCGSNFCIPSILKSSLGKGLPSPALLSLGASFGSRWGWRR